MDEPPEDEFSDADVADEMDDIRLSGIVGT